VVAFDRGALGEVIVQERTGFLVASGDIHAAADAVQRTSGLSRSECRAHAERRLDLGQSLEGHERLYRRVVGAGAGAAVHG
jgi:glycosyltransferase involved in cell wall biosynthesis